MEQGNCLYSNYFLNQGNLAFGFENIQAAVIANANAPNKKLIAKASNEINSPNLPPDRLKIQSPNTKFTKPQIIFTMALESFANGVMCLLPKTPETKWGTPFVKNMPAINPNNKFIFSPPFKQKHFNLIIYPY